MKGELFGKIATQSIWRSQYPNEISINEEALKQIIDEMRKEYPKAIPLARWAELNKIREEWFRKWFGAET